MISPDRYFRELWEGKRCGWSDKLIIVVLTPCALVYSIVLRIRGVLYRLGILPSFRLGVPVISVGNLSVGGTGKTPLSVHVARLLVARGKRVVVLSRGYGGAGGSAVRVVSDGARILLSASDAGDEPVLLARSVAGLIVVTGSDRYRAGVEAIKRFNPNVILLDDGFQHLRLQRDLNILLLDAARPFGNGWTLPAGLLREPRSALHRADLIVYTRADKAMEIQNVAGIPVCRSAHRLTGVVSLFGGELSSFSILSGKKGVACAGIADSGSFFSALEQEGLDLAARISFRDHCPYDQTERAEINRVMKESGADYLITTEKDGVKLASFQEVFPDAYAAVLDLEVFDSSVLVGEIEKLL